MGGSLFVLRVFCLCVSFCQLCSLFTVSSDHFFQRAENHERGREGNQSRARRASTFLPINPLKSAKINNTRFGCIGMPWDIFDLVRFSCDALFPRSYFMLISSAVH